MDSNPKMKLLRFGPDLYSSKLSHSISNFINTDGCTDWTGSVAYCIYLAIREIRGILVLVDQMAVPISNIRIGLTGFIGATYNGNGGDNWSYKTCKAPVKMSPPTNQHPMFLGRMPFLSPNQHWH